MKKHQDIFVSVVIPTFNRASLLRRSISSVLKQTYSNLELIIVDDGSTDNTKDVVDSFKDPRIKYIKHKINKNGAIARNTGIKAAKGKYIAFLDSDDEWVSEKIQKQLDWVLKFSEDDNFACYTQVIKKTNRSKTIRPKRGKSSKESLADYLFINRGLMQTSTLLIPRSLLMKVQFRDLDYHQDWDLCLRLEQLGVKFIFLESPLTIWHIHSQGGRVSKNIGYHDSLNWIEKYKNNISPESYSAFLKKRNK
ncbi:glycosyltransferase family 2 protein [Ammoniphilus sp. 3BR4]|uniref:glycosyltransferase family 2 protein n=1 Tax=Ammoniphilus sp. 3BR4 TaxID=3158265 RepID=UPI0034651CFE